MKLRSDRRMRNARNKRPPTKHNRDTLEQLCLQTVGFNEREADEAGLSRSDRLTDIQDSSRSASRSAPHFGFVAD